ncbi:MAG: hypothetical protein V1928_05205 [Parcubacteria group bacterium]
MSDDISLLPSDLRGREGEEKKKAKEASVKPQFKMHLPDEDRVADARDDKSVPHGEANGVREDIEIGANGARKKENQGVFKIVKKDAGVVEKDGSGHDVVKEALEENNKAPEVNLMMKKFFDSKKHQVLFKVMIIVVGVVLILTVAMIASFYFPQFIK